MPMKILATDKPNENVNTVFGIRPVGSFLFAMFIIHNIAVIGGDWLLESS